jgi:SAM-dependent methyltransferase
VEKISEMKVPYFCVPWIRKQRTGYKNHIKEFKQHLEKEFEEMKSFLPKSCNSILDIGCGLGGIDILLSKEYDNPELYLLDNSFISEKVIHGFDHEKSYYNSFEITNALLTVNDIENYNLIDIKNGFPELNNIELVISLLSWGYHYKIEEYLDKVYSVMSPGAILIMDIRENTNGIEVLKTKFKLEAEISNYNKSHRVCARRRQDETY